MNIVKELFFGPGSGFVEGLRKAQIWPIVVNSDYEPGWVGSSFSIAVSTLPGMREKISAIVASQLNALQNAPISEDDWRRSSALAFTRESQRWQSRAAQVIDFARFKNFGLGIEELRNFLTIQRGLQREEIKAAVRSIGSPKLLIAGIEGNE